MSKTLTVSYDEAAIKAALVADAEKEWKRKATVSLEITPGYEGGALDSSRATVKAVVTLGAPLVPTRNDTGPDR